MAADAGRGVKEGGDRVGDDRSERRVMHACMHAGARPEWGARGSLGRGVRAKPGSGRQVAGPAAAQLWRGAAMLVLA